MDLVSMLKSTGHIPELEKRDWLLPQVALEVWFFPHQLWQMYHHMFYHCWSCNSQTFLAAFTDPVGRLLPWCWTLTRFSFRLLILLAAQACITKWAQPLCQLWLVSAIGCNTVKPGGQMKTYEIGLVQFGNFVPRIQPGSYRNRKTHLHSLSKFRHSNMDLVSMLKSILEKWMIVFKFLWKGDSSLAEEKSWPFSHNKHCWSFSFSGSSCSQWKAATLVSPPSADFCLLPLPSFQCRGWNPQTTANPWHQLKNLSGEKICLPVWRVSQSVPPYPRRQSHLYWEPISWHCPPFKHGEESQAANAPQTLSGNHLGGKLFLTWDIFSVPGFMFTFRR